ncbi:uracil-DNA glycosylase family protein [Candidatus Anaplasma sp. TIGMIC]|uniref:uracil-DNA glycosylase n=1 Tax=Candidatus Anaplasma sp. TIGMIC TaxID=3020713 RepID=UPI00232F3565|nr:uracil-DNA glycosylase [Candidatus Anaplasma sp. TIGMIC]MDB1135457.1 uracil-DNA glycosylase [Candidatus Anaplasma sp. TIGMIC]
MTNGHAEQGPDSPAVLAEVLKFYHDSGATCTLRDSLDAGDAAQISEETRARRRDPVKKQHKTVETSLLHWAMEAKTAAMNCNNLEELRRAICAFEGCEIKKSAMNTVFSDGNACAKIMLIGEAPGSSEDREGIPFCGASGQLLDKMFAAIGLSRATNIYISNSVFWRPPGNRKPTDFELEVCRPFVEKHISLIDPDVVVMVGSTACCALMQTQDSISRIRGKFYEYTNSFLSRTIAAMAIFHPAYLLRQPLQKRLAWEDLKMLRAHIETHNIKVR